MIEIPQKLPKEITDKYSIINNAFRLDKIVNAEKDVYKNEPKDEINVEIGDTKQTDFYPQVKLQRWSNEVNFSVRLKQDDYSGAVISTDKDKIVWEKGNFKIENYENENGYKYVWYLKEKPASNKIEFTIQSKGLDFFYQPELTQEEKDKGAIRPENVVGSYAVYHQTKGVMNDINSKDYKAGKAFHIYRPHLTDAVGKETWGNLHIENGLYEITIPQDFLDKAVYPIKSNDTFGYESIGGSYTNIAIRDNGNNRYAYETGVTYTIATAGTLDSLHVALKQWLTDAIDVWVALFRENSEGIGSHARVASVERTGLVISTTPAFEDFTAASEELIADDYILTVLGNPVDISTKGYNAVVYYDSTTGRNYYIETTGGYNNTTAYATRKAEDPWTYNATGTTQNYSIYATYTPSAAEGTNFQINISDVWKPVTKIQINISDTWKEVIKAQVNISDTWKTIF